MTGADGAVRGVAVRRATRAGARGRVVSAHRKAVYLDLDGALIALVSPGVEPGPLHLRSGPLPPAVGGERVTCDGSRITGRSWAVRCDVPLWEGVLPARWPDDPPAGSGRAGRSERRDRATAASVPAIPAGDGSVTGIGHGTAIPTEVPVDPDTVSAAVRAGAIDELAGLLGGRGPGLTPAGDDLLAGLVLAARARWGRRAEARLATAVDDVRTTRPAQAFLHWAARGQCLAPAHDVLAALADGGPSAAAEGRLEATGASSGRCLLAGLRIGVAQLPRLDIQSARAGEEARLCTRAR